jgi:hypothetical protein
MNDEDKNREHSKPLDEEEQIAEAVERSYGRRMAGTEPKTKTPNKEGDAGISQPRK